MSSRNYTSINGRTPVTTASEGKVIGVLDVCMTPSPGGPVPVPFVNIAQSKDLENGSKAVLIQGASVALDTSYIGTSTGDEPGSAGGGIISGTTTGRAHPITYSLNVRIEGRPVVRNLDQFTLNNRNTAPFPIIQPQAEPPRPVQVDEVRLEHQAEVCSYCGKGTHPFARPESFGANMGNSAVLGRNMLEGSELGSHAWYAGPFSLAAHHLICLESLDNKKWAQFCSRFGYHPDRKPNGVFLPMKMTLACQLRVAVHRGNHAEGYSFDFHLAYPDAVKGKLADVAERIERGEFCSEPDALIEELDDLSAQILAKVTSFSWTLTRDGRDYAPGGVGCAGLKSLRHKPSDTPCPYGRQHYSRTAEGQPWVQLSFEAGV